MQECPWPKGCSQLSYSGLCYYHQKVADGLLDLHPLTEREKPLKTPDQVVDDETLGIRGLLVRLENALHFRPRAKRRGGGR